MPTASNNKLTSLLKKAAGTWEETTAAAKKSGGYENLPAGNYVAKRIGYEIKETNDGSKWGMTTQWEVLEGDYKGRQYFKWMSLFEEDDAENGLSVRVVQELEKFTGTDAEDLDVTELETLMEDTDGQVWQIKIGNSKTSDGVWMNLVKQLDADDYADNEPTTSAKKTTAMKKTGLVPAKPEATKSTAKTKAAPAPEPDPEEAESEFEEGDEVTWTVTTGKGKAAKTEEFSGTYVGINEEDDSLADIDTGETETTGVGKNKKTVPVYTQVELSELSKVEPEEDEDDGSEGANVPFEEGEEVTYTVTTGRGKTAKTEEKTGTIYSVDMESETCDIDTGEVTGTGKNKKAVIDEGISFDVITKIEDEEGETVTYEVGQEIVFDNEGNETSATITEIDEDNQALEVTWKVGRKSLKQTISFSDVIPEEGDGDDEENSDAPEWEVGAKAEFVDAKRQTKQGTVVAIDEEAMTLTIKVGAMKHTVPVDEAQMLIEA